MSVATPDPLQRQTAQTLETARAGLAANQGERANLRSKADSAEFRLALRDLRDGVRGMIRVSPLLSVVTAALIGAAWSRRGRRRAVVRR